MNGTMVAFGSYGEISGAKIATKTQNPTNIAPIIPTGVSRIRPMIPINRRNPSDETSESVFVEVAFSAI